MKKFLGTQQWMLGTLTVAAAYLGFAASASAGFVPVFVTEDTTTNSSVFVYTINFTSNGNTESLTSGDFFTLYDIGTPTAMSLSGPFTFSSALTGVTAPLTAPVDSSSILNLTATYTGGTITADTTFTETLTYAGTNLATTNGYYSSTDSIASGKNGQAGRITLPSAVPEPSTYAALALGGVMGAVMLRRRAVIA